MAFYIDSDRCVDCGYCKTVCLFGAVEERKLDDGRYVFAINDRCHGCAPCAEGCLVGCILPAEGHRPIAEVTIDPARCNGCSLCHHICPAFAVEGELKVSFHILQERCIHCGLCASRCKQKAIDVRYAQ